MSETTPRRSELPLRDSHRPSLSEVIQCVLQGGSRIHQASSSGQVGPRSRRAIEPLGKTMSDNDVDGELGECFNDLRRYSLCL